MSKQKQRRKKSKAGLIIGLIITLVVAASVGIGLFLGIRQYQTLKTERDKIIAMNTKEGKIDQRIYTTGSYGNIERIMKSYMQEYVDSMNDIRNLFQEDEFAGLLSLDNLEADAPDFEKSLAYLEELETKAETAFAILETKNQTENIMAPAQNMNFIFKALYRSLMTGRIQEEFMFSSSEIAEIKEQVEATIESRKNMILFLCENSKGWEIVDGKLNFTSDKLLEEYNHLKDSIQ